jgi:hypothetical protein
MLLSTQDCRGEGKKGGGEGWEGVNPRTLNAQVHELTSTSNVRSYRKRFLGYLM